MNFFNLESGYEIGALQLRFVNPKKIDQLSLLKGKNIDIGDLTFEYAYGQKEFDLILCGFTSLFLISEKFANLIERNALKGCFLTKIDTDLLELTHQYYLLSVVGKSGPILNELSKQSTFKPDIPGAKESIVWKGLFFNPETHDGSDFFIPEGSQFVFITELAHNKIITAGLENIRMINIADMINLSLR